MTTTLRIDSTAHDLDDERFGAEDADLVLDVEVREYRSAVRIGRAFAVLVDGLVEARELTSPEADAVADEFRQGVRVPSGRPGE